MCNRQISINPIFVFTTIAILSIALHWNIWERDIMGIHAWRQTQTMTVVENFAFEDMNILNPRINARGDGDGIFRMEFPLMQWVFAWAYKWFGPQLISARILTFIISLFSIFGFYQLLRAYQQSKWISAIGTWCLSWSPVFFYYSVNPLPDNLALCFGIWSLVFLKQYQSSNQISLFILFIGFLALATAVKLPFILFGAGYLPLFVQSIRQKTFRKVITEIAMMLFLAPTAMWYLWVIPNWGKGGIVGGIAAESSFDYIRALNTIWGTLISMLPELFINYGSALFFLVGVAVLFKTKMRRIWSEASILFFLLLFYLYEVNMIGMAHDYYLLPFLPFIFLIVTNGAKTLFQQTNKTWRVIAYAALLILPFTAFIRTKDRWKTSDNNKFLVHKNALKQAVPNDALVVVGNDPSMHISLYHLAKKGWTFEQDWLSPALLEDYINRGAQYLYSNSEKVNHDKKLAPYLEEVILEKPGITVYSLKKP
ncbi:ArnT family glycosyltransferase [Bacteroidota bacterium]